MADSESPNNVGRILAGVVVLGILVAILIMAVEPVRVQVSIYLSDLGLMTNEVKFIEFSNPNTFKLSDIADMVLYDPDGSELKKQKPDLKEIKVEPAGLGTNLLEFISMFSPEYKGVLPTRVWMPLLAPVRLSKVTILLNKPNTVAGTTVRLLSKSGNAIRQITLTDAVSQDLVVMSVPEAKEATTPTDGPLGGVGTPEVQTAPVVPAVVEVATATGNSGVPIKMLYFVKTIGADELQPIGENPDWKTFPVAEVVVHDANGSKLTASNFESAEFNDPMGAYAEDYPGSNAYDGDVNTFAHTSIVPIVNRTQQTSLTLTLKNPTVISKLQVFNRTDCGTAPCSRRLSGTKLHLLDAKGSTVKTLDIGPGDSATFMLS